MAMLLMMTVMMMVMMMVTMMMMMMIVTPRTLPRPPDALPHHPRRLPTPA